MLSDLLPKSHVHYLSLPVLGSVLEDFDDWLIAQGYRHTTRQCYILRCASIEAYLHRRHHTSLGGLTPETLRECWQYHHLRAGGIAGVVGCLLRFLQIRQILPPPVPVPAAAFSETLTAYRQYLHEVRALAPHTIEQHCSTAAQFLQHRRNSDPAFRIVDLTQPQIEGFVTEVGTRYSRGSLQHVVAQLRSFLRFLGMQGQAPLGLGSQIDTARVYRLEQLPRALPWDTVCALLTSIDRSSARGLRDYAMLSLIAAYGMRRSDIAGLRLSDIDWRAGEIRIEQRKTAAPLRLPLTDPVAAALLAYLRAARPRVACREIFLTVQAPIRPIVAPLVTDVFRYWAKRSGLEIPFQGVHCLRHAYAIRLLRQGVSLKTIGDLLGHRSTESTCVYLRLNLDDLREVALPLPALPTEEMPS